MDNQKYINRLKKNLRHPRAKMYRRIAGFTAIIFGMFLAGTELWREFQSEKINDVIKTEYLPALASKGEVSADDLSTLHSLIIAQAKMDHSSSNSFIGGIFIGLGVLVLMGIFTKPQETIVSLWERVEVLENQLAVQGSSKTASEQGTADHP